MADIVTLDTTDFKITEMFKAGYREGRDGVDEMSREAASKRGKEDALADRGRALDDAVESDENVSVAVCVSCDEQAAYALGWDIGWQDEVRDQYRRGFAEGQFRRLIAPHAPHAPSPANPTR